MSALISQARIDDLRLRYRVSDVAARRTRLRKAGPEYVGLCPFHKERTPSFTVNDIKGFYHCFGCGSHGDIIRFVQETEGLSFPDAVAAIDGAGLPPVDPSWLATAKEEDAALDREKAETAQAFWDAGCTIDDTPASAYLEWRMISVNSPEMRFDFVPSWRDEGGNWRDPKPCLMLRVTDPRRRFMGIQRIFLTPDGRKANMAKPKLSLANVRGGAVRLGSGPDPILTGGPEDGLTIYEDNSERRPVLISCGEAMMPSVRLGRYSGTLTIARQNDAPGRIAAAKAAKAHREKVLVKVVAPDPAFKDWNDQKRGIRIDLEAAA